VRAARWQTDSYDSDRPRYLLRKQLPESVMENARTKSHKPVTKNLAKRGGKMRILVVEDHSDTRTVLATLLSRCGCQTVIAKNMKDARSRLAEMSFDALVSDLNLPDGDGLDLVAEAKRLHVSKAIAVTGRTAVAEQERGLRAGCDFYLTKPVDFHQLRCALGIPPHPSTASLPRP
jgi:CheY-like chemotaxis protein